MSETQNAPPLINPAVVEKWNEIDPKSNVELILTRQDWDNLFVALISTQYALRSLQGAITSVGNASAREAIPSMPLSALNELWSAQSFSNDAHQRTVRFIETVMLRARVPKQ